MNRTKEKRPGLAGTKTKGAKVYTKRSKHTDRRASCKCPRCNFEAPAPLFAPGWLDDLQMRAARFWSLGLGPDLSALSLIELHALWRWLLRQG